MGTLYRYISVMYVATDTFIYFITRFFVLFCFLLFYVVFCDIIQFVIMYTIDAKEHKMDLNSIPEHDGKMRIIQEIVPGKQITLAHIIANPEPVIYNKLGLNPDIDYSKSAIGILTMSPAETAVIAGDLAMKTSGVDIGFIDRFSGTVIITGSLSEVESSLTAVVDYCSSKLDFTICHVTRT